MAWQPQRLPGCLVNPFPPEVWPRTHVGLPGHPAPLGSQAHLVPRVHSMQSGNDVACPPVVEANRIWDGVHSPQPSADRKSTGRLRGGSQLPRHSEGGGDLQEGSDYGQNITRQTPQSPLWPLLPEPALLLHPGGWSCSLLPPPQCPPGKPTGPRPTECFCVRDLPGPFRSLSDLPF